jgi:hypothetical protein
MRRAGSRRVLKRSRATTPSSAVCSGAAIRRWVEPLAWDGEGHLYSLWTDTTGVWLALRRSWRDVGFVANRRESCASLPRWRFDSR